MTYSLCETRTSTHTVPFGPWGPRAKLKAAVTACEERRLALKGAPPLAPAADVRLVERPRVCRRERLPLLGAEQGRVPPEQEAKVVRAHLCVARVGRRLAHAGGEAAPHLLGGGHPPEPAVHRGGARLRRRARRVVRERQPQVDQQRAGGEGRGRLLGERRRRDGAFDRQQRRPGRLRLLREVRLRKVLPVAALCECLPRLWRRIVGQRRERGVVARLGARAVVDVQVDAAARDAAAHDEVRHIRQRAAEDGDRPSRDLAAGESQAGAPSHVGRARTLVRDYLARRARNTREVVRIVVGRQATLVCDL
mmetsp:Transcript_50524/g.163719  ORF Transcript_50524/g.163719 Transcript_50524/m.163719 type:complete len:308 (+) Transcript_50524:33-956(+)